MLREPQTVSIEGYTRREEQMILPAGGFEPRRAFWSPEAFLIQLPDPT
jgi:hypothetical protein